MVTVSLQEKNGVYQAVLNYRDENNKRKQKWKSTGLTVKGNKKLAMQKAEEIKTDFEKSLISNNDDNEIGNMLFADYMLYWLKITKSSIEETTYTSYYQTIHRRTYPYFSSKRIKLVDIQPIHIQEFYNSMYMQGLKGHTVLHYHANIRTALEYAYQMGYILNNPADRVKRPKKDLFIGDFYNEQEMYILFEKSKGDPLEIPIMLSAFYGLRRSEVLGIKWNAIDFANNSISIKHTVNEIRENGKVKIIMKDRTKNKSSYRTLPLVDEIIVALKELKSEQESNKKLFGNSYNKKHEDYVCVDKMGSIIKPGYVSQHFPFLLSKKNLRHIRFHDLRHSCASLLLAKKVSMSQIQEWLGHSNYSTTANIYAHLDTNSKQKSAKALVNIFKNTAKKENEEINSSSSNKLINVIN